jgi:hypothetical protein
VPARLAWAVMESPAVVLFALVYGAGPRRAEAAPLALLALWQLHYLHRAVVYPLRLRPGGTVPLAIPALAIAFNALNGWINARWISALGAYPQAGSPRRASSPARRCSSSASA